MFSLSLYWRLLRTNRNFRLLWMAQIVSELGDWLYTVAVYSLLLEYTGKAQSIALAFVLQVLPNFFIAPAAGILNDRLSRKKVMIFADWTRAGIVLCMVLVRGPGLVWLLYVLLFCETLLWGLFEPGRTAAVPNLVRGEDVVVANTLSSTTWSVNFALGAALGGVIAVYFGRDTVFVLNAVSFVVSALLLRRLNFVEPHVENLPPVRLRDLASFAPVIEGIRYVRGNRRLRATLLVKAGIGFLGANWVVLPIFGERVFPLTGAGIHANQAGMLGMSLLMTARGLGAIAGPIVSGTWAKGREARMRAAIFFGFLAGFAGYVGLGLAPTLILACAGIMLAHGGQSSNWVFSTTLLQLQTEDRFRGRVFAADWAFAVLTMSASSWIAGLLIDRGLPVTRLAIAVGCLMLLPAIAWAWALRLWRTSPNMVI